jgi:hypothetical protein
LVWSKGEYLPTLRHEWFDVFDSLAELQKVSIPCRVNSRFQQNMDYVSTKNSRKFPGTSVAGGDDGKGEKKSPKATDLTKDMDAESLADDEDAPAPKTSSTTEAERYVSTKNSRKFPGTSVAGGDDGKGEKKNPKATDLTKDMDAESPADDEDAPAPKTSSTTEDPSARGKKKRHSDVDFKAEAKKLRTMVPWLDIPDDETECEPNNWTPNWRKFGNGDLCHFFGQCSVDKPAHLKDDNDKANCRTLQDFLPNQLTSEKIEAYHKKWIQFNDMGKAVCKKEVLDRYVDSRFTEWQWSTTAQHIAEKKYYEAMKVLHMENAKSKADKEKILHYYTDLLTGMEKERRYYRRMIERDYHLDNVKSVTGIRFDKVGKRFVARVVYQEELPEKAFKNKKGKNIIPTQAVFEEVEVTEDWVINQSGLAEDVVQYIIDFGVEDGFFPVPIEKDIKINDRKIVRIKYVPETTRMVRDVSSIAQGKLASLPSKRTRGSANAKDEGSPTKGLLPRKVIKVAAFFRVIYANGERQSMTEEILKEHFSAKFLDELKKMKCPKSRFTTIPVGDYKISHLHHYPELRISGAPKLRFSQDSNQDLCVSNSLASVFFNLGFHEQAKQ